MASPSTLSSLFFRGLVPLHNACSYGHYEVVELLLKYNANVNAVDLWKFTPIHEAAAKGKYEICKLLLKVRCHRAKKGDQSSSPFFSMGQM